MKSQNVFGQKMIDALLETLATGKPTRVPAGGDLIWQWFTDLSATRSSHMSGPNPITYQEIVAYSKTNRWELAPNHIALIRAMDDAYINDFYSKRAKNKDGGSVKTIARSSSAVITPALFDALF